jgi:drug/metabolite transporter (DMT)-like permease
MRRAYLLTLIAVAAWATGPVGNKALLAAQRGSSRLQPLQVAFWCVFAGWLALVALLLARGRATNLRQIPGRGWGVLALMGFFGFLGYPVTINIAFSLLSLPDALVISYLNPVFVVLFQSAAFGALLRPLSGWEQEAAPGVRPQPARTAAGLALCLLGVAFIATQGKLGSLGAVRSVGGAVAASLAAVSWGLYSNLGRFVRMRRGAADVQTAAGMAFGLIPLAVVLALTGQLGLPSGYYAALRLGRVTVEASAWSLIAVVGLVNYGVGYPLWIAALAAGRAAGGACKLPALTYITLVVAVALGWALLGEHWGAGFWQGAAFIAAGNVVTLLRPAGPARP